jgi:hypothetical protein
MQAIEQMFNFYTTTYNDPKNLRPKATSEYRQIGSDMYKRYPSIKR